MFPNTIVVPLDGSEFAARPLVLHGTYAAGAIADSAVRVDADLVAMSSHARAGTDRVALGSVTIGVVGMARCPMLVSRTA